MGQRFRLITLAAVFLLGGIRGDALLAVAPEGTPPSIPKPTPRPEPPPEPEPRPKPTPKPPHRDAGPRIVPRPRSISPTRPPVEPALQLEKYRELHFDLGGVWRWEGIIDCELWEELEDLHFRTILVKTESSSRK